jgi:TPR repeat protein
MRISNSLRGACATLVLGFVFGAASAGSALALDAKRLAQQTPAEAFRIGFDAYRQGDKTGAAQALEMAAGKGHLIAQWKLGRMYAEGDGIAEDPLKAFGLFSQVANAYADESPNSPSAPFVANSFVALGTYYREGIPNSKVKPDFDRARQMFNYAASYFGDADAQMNLAMMYFQGEGGAKDPRQAARWAKLAAEKGNVGAQALLGHLLFEGDGVGRQPVVGLMFLTIARERATGPNQNWIKELQEDAFSIATETERRTATAMADEWQNKNKSASAAAAAVTANIK